MWAPGQEPTQLNLGDTGITSVVWSTGFGRDDRWIEVPVFDGRGYPTHDRGVTSSPGLYFLGLPWQHTWGSGRLSGVADDAAYLTERIISGPAHSDHLFRWIAGTRPAPIPVTTTGSHHARWRDAMPIDRVFDAHRPLRVLPAFPFYGGPAANPDTTARATVAELISDLDAEGTERVLVIPFGRPRPNRGSR